MHEYSQTILRRLMDSSRVPQEWIDNNFERFARWLYEKAPSCKCGCGKRTYYDSQKIDLTEAIRRFEFGTNAKYADFLPNHKKLKVSENYKPTGFEHQIIIASICGDGSLSLPYRNRPCNPRIQWNMGNRDHALYKFNAFNDFIGARFSERNNPGFGEKWYCVATKSHPLLLKYIDKYGERKKNLSVDSGIFDELNEIGWAWLYGDDGHISRDGNAFIHTECFSIESVNKIRESLNAFIGFDGSRVHSYIGGAKKRQMHCIRMTNGGTDEFIKKVKAHMADGMEYKISKNNR